MAVSSFLFSNFRVISFFPPFSFQIDIKTQLSISRFCWFYVLVFSLSFAPTLVKPSWLLTGSDENGNYLPSLHCSLSWLVPIYFLCCHHNDGFKTNLEQIFLTWTHPWLLYSKRLWGTWIIDKKFCLWLFYFMGEVLVFYHILNRNCIIPNYIKTTPQRFKMMTNEENNWYLDTHSDKKFYYLSENMVTRNPNGICD